MFLSRNVDCNSDCSGGQSNIEGIELDRLVEVCLPKIRDYLFKKDTNHDGSLSIYELSSNTPLDQLKNNLALFHQFDCDKNGVVTMDELKSALTAQIQSKIVQQANAIVTRYDKNQDGVMTIYEVIEGEADPNIRNAVNAFRTMDKNYDFKAGKSETELFAFEKALRNPNSVCNNKN